MIRSKWVALLAAIALVVAFTSASALAGDVDVADVSGFGTLVPPSPLTTSLAVAGDFSATVTANAYFDSTTGVYTYVYDLANNSGNGLTAASTSSFGVNNFSNSLNYGVVTGSTTKGLNDSGFTFTGSSFAAGLAGGSPNNVAAGDTFTFYAQSLISPGGGTFTAHDGGLGGNTNTITPSPEAGSIFLLSLVLLGGLMVGRKQLFA